MSRNTAAEAESERSLGTIIKDLTADFSRLFRSEIALLKLEIKYTIAKLGGHISELDRRLRTTFDLQKAASEHAPQLAAGGAVVGFLFGFGFPKAVKTLLRIGVPIAVITIAAKKYASRNGDEWTG